MILFSFVLSFVGFFVLILAMKRHYVQVLSQGNLLSTKLVVVFRVMGFGCLIAACGLCILSKGLSVGLVYWIGLLTPVALIQTLLLSYSPQWLVRIVLMVLMIGAVSGWKN